MEYIRKIISYSQFEHVNINLSADTLNVIQKIKRENNLKSFNETRIDYIDVADALFTIFPLNQFNTTSGLTPSFTVITTTEPHELKIGDRFLLYPLFGQSDLISATTVSYLGNSIGSDSTHSFITRHDYIQTTNGLILTNIDYVLSFFKGFNVQPTQSSIDLYLTYLLNYLDSPDVGDVDDIGVGAFYKGVPRNIFNDLGYQVVTSGGTTSGATITIPLYLTQKIENLGIYNNPYSATTDTKDLIVNDISVLDPTIDERNQDIFIATGTTVFSPNVSNNFPYRIIDGITGNTISDFYDTSVDITGVTTNMAKRVVKYVGDDVRYQYKLSDSLLDITHTITPNTIPGTNDGWITYRTIRPVRSSTISYLSYTSCGLSENNVNVDFNPSRAKELAVVFDEFNLGSVQEPKIINDLFIDKGVFSVFEKVEKISDVTTLDDLVSFENNKFNVVNDQPSVNRYVVKTNG